MHPLAPNQANAKQVLSRRCSKSSYKTKTNTNKMECAVCYDMKNIVKINCNHGFCKPCLKKIIKTKENDIDDDSFVTCPLCRRDVTKTKNKSVNVSLNECNKLQNMKQQNPTMKIWRITYKRRKYKVKKSFDRDIKNYPDKMKFKTYQNYI